MELAHQIHQVLVPAIDLRIGEFEFSGFSAASGEVGGDLVDVVTREDKWFGYVADVSGHGVSSGVVMGMFKSALRMRLLQGGTISALLDDLNNVLFPLKSGATYVTAACVRGPVHADASGGRPGTGGQLEFAVAGHLPILRVRAGVVDEITTAQIPVGMFEDYRFTSSTLACKPGDVLALITDGLTEVFDARDREFGMEAVKQLLAASAALPLPEIATRIVTAARAHGAQFDDQTLLLIRRL
jgi:sigma-B regulation protein RsbU (phosphoserine phosphatase)